MRNFYPYCVILRKDKPMKIKPLFSAKHKRRNKFKVLFLLFTEIFLRIKKNNINIRYEQ